MIDITINSDAIVCGMLGVGLIGLGYLGYKSIKYDHQIQREKNDILSSYDYEDLIRRSSIKNEMLSVEERVLAYQYLQSLFANAKKKTSVSDFKKALNNLRKEAEIFVTDDTYQIQAILRLYSEEQEEKKAEKEMEKSRLHELELVKTEANAKVAQAKAVANGIQGAVQIASSKAQ